MGYRIPRCRGRQSRRLACGTCYARQEATQLAEINVKPADIAFVAVSHTHGDHVGNVDLFPTSTLLIQKAEFDWAFMTGKQPPSPSSYICQYRLDRAYRRPRALQGQLGQ